ncbi:MAG: MaoC family dehydratase N-terminal domain-containing protein [Micrococcales bacterium]|nr:MaoC family dehydratase N-terminal domain-containing protein [Micrococcales bacterium]
MTRRAFADVSVGDALPETTVHITRATLVQYAGASLDRNPIHWDERFAQSVGLPDVIAHGMFTMGAAATTVEDWAGDAGAVVELGTRFTKPVVVSYDEGADVVYGGKVTALDEQTRQATLEVSATCGEDKVLGRCTARVQLA